ncbi:substrate-binding periplasmic protein [Dongshaea marina]|uniref:substrate-binding periplasmic protein n=1 Tax=Dongshaea marina TaxID=2047966 RepID=UPI000D3EA984|nr:transporter substrate-binding domain-containing protein [Dongshaea marina]
MAYLRSLVLVFALAVRLSQARALTQVTVASGEWPPYTSVKLEKGGLANAIATEAFASQGVSLKIQYTSWSRAIRLVQAGAIDITLPWAMTPKRQQSFSAIPMGLSVERRLFFNKAKPFHWQNRTQLLSAKIGILRNYSYGAEFTPLLKSTNSEYGKDESANLKKLYRQRIDVFPCDVIVCSYFLSLLPFNIAREIGQDTTTFQSEPMFVLIGKEHPQHKEIIEVYRQGLATIRANGRLKELMSSFGVQ